MAYQERFKMEVVLPTNANAYCVEKSKMGTNVRQRYMAFADGQTGTCFYKIAIPACMAATPAWNVQLECERNAAGGAGNNIVMALAARICATNEDPDATMTDLISVASATTFAVNAVDRKTLVNLSGTNFDATLTIASPKILYAKLVRVGGHASDTIDTELQVEGLYLLANLK